MNIKTTAAEWEEWQQKNSDPYGSGVVRYTERWANMMEAEIAQGKALKDIAKQTSHDADTEGITGFMYGCAVGALSHFWIHGEELRKWHNKDYGVAETEEGVVNPAILTIETRKPKDEPEEDSAS